LGRTKLVDPDVTSAFKLGSVDDFASQECIPDQVSIGLGVDHGLQEFSVRRLNRQGVVNFNGLRRVLAASLTATLCRAVVQRNLST
jgi:hypothetical protein